MLNERQALRLIEATHRAALDPSCWQDVIDELHLATEESPIGLHKLYGHKGQILTSATSGYDPDFIETYIDHYAVLSPWIDCFRTYPKQRALLVSEMNLPASFESSEFYNDWVLPQDICYGASIRTREVGSLSLIAGISTRARDRDRLEKASQSLLAWLEPHLAHALAVNEEIGRLSAGAMFNPTGAAPASIATGGVLIVTSQHLLCWADAGAIALIGDLLRLTPSGRLSFVDPTIQSWFEVVAAFASGPDRPVRGPRLEVAMRRGAQVWTVRAIHCDDHIAAGVSFPGLLMSMRPPGGRALALVIAPRGSVPGPAELLRRRFGLSAAEAEVALRIGEGLDTDHIATLRGSSRHTVRNQVQSILSKMEARSRAEVITIIARLPTEN